MIHAFTGSQKMSALMLIFYVSLQSQFQCDVFLSHLAEAFGKTWVYYCAKRCASCIFHSNSILYLDAGPVKKLARALMRSKMLKFK